MTETIFSENVIVASTRYVGGAVIWELVAGKSLKIETYPAGEEILDREVPAGKKWKVEMSVVINETDV